MNGEWVGVAAGCRGCCCVGSATDGAGIGVGLIGMHMLDGMARQPEMAGRLQTSALVFAALVEGVALFAVVIAFLISNKF